MTPRGILKGLARATGGGRLVQRKHTSLNREGEEALFRVASVMSEGIVRDGGTFFGSTMITFDLEALAPDWRVTLDNAERERLLRTIEGSVRVRLRALRIARAQALQHVSNRPLGTAYADMKFSLRGRHLHLDVDLEAEVAVSSALSGT
ncbi:MAG: hypothetical protein IPK60_21755 [Sandaracinaceae bacterium]|jgi:hypothetical protein|nr:hypothetical protein [Sandaracinaceae bacterium]